MSCIYGRRLVGQGAYHFVVNLVAFPALELSAQIFWFPRLLIENPCYCTSIALRFSPCLVRALLYELFCNRVIYIVKQTALRPIGLYHGLYFVIHTLQEFFLVPGWFPSKFVSVLCDALRAGVVQDM